MAISATTIRELREKSGAGMLDCKKALTETNGNLEEAVDWLREKGLAAAAKKSSRVAAEGLVGVAVQGNKASVVEVNSETDFVARNETFQGFVAQTATLALGVSDFDALKGTAYSPEQSVEETLVQMVGTIGENLSLRRMQTFVSSDNEVVSTYVHNAIVPGLGKIGVLVALEAKESLDAAQKEKVEAFGKKIAMHVAAASPSALTREDVPAEMLERERKVITEQVKDLDRPEHVIEKMIEGRIRKFFEDTVLLEQSFVVDPSKTVQKAVEAEGKDLGLSLSLKAFARFELGQGIEKVEEDFASEVAAQLNK